MHLRLYPHATITYFAPYFATYFAPYFVLTCTRAPTCAGAGPSGLRHLASGARWRRGPRQDCCGRCVYLASGDISVAATQAWQCRTAMLEWHPRRSSYGQSASATPV
eukprot:3445033-Pyramimonas_sp.AAC.5